MRSPIQLTEVRLKWDFDNIGADGKDCEYTFDVTQTIINNKTRLKRTDLKHNYKRYPLGGVAIAKHAPFSSAYTLTTFWMHLTICISSGSGRKFFNRWDLNTGRDEYSGHNICLCPPFQNNPFQMFALVFLNENTFYSFKMVLQNFEILS